MTINPLEEMRVFVATVEAGGFTAAGARLGMTKQRVSRTLIALEERLGVRLLNRTTRRLDVTELGQDFYLRAQAIITALDEAEAAITERGDALQGTLRMSAPVSFGMRYLGPLVASFLERHPHAKVRLDLNDRAVDLLEEGFDMAVRIGVLADSTLRARRLVDAEMVLCCSPQYLREQGVPRNPGELSHRECLCYGHHGQADTVEWRFVPSGGALPDDARFKRAQTISVRGRMQANNGEIVRDAAVAGLGIAVLPDFIVEDALADGRLLRMPTDFRPVPAAVFAVYPQHRQGSRLLRAFIEHLADGLASRNASSSAP